MSALVSICALGSDIYIRLPQQTGLSLADAYASFPTRTLPVIAVSAAIWVLLTVATATIGALALAKDGKSTFDGPFSRWKVIAGVLLTLGVGAVSASMASVFVAGLVDAPGVTLGSSWAPFSEVLVAGLLFSAAGTVMWVLTTLPWTRSGTRV